MRGLAVLLVGLTLAGCAGMQSRVTDAVGLTKPAPQAAAKTAPDPKTQMAALETQIETMVEAERLKIDPKAHPLALDPELGTIARERAADMAAKNYFAHTAPDGETSASLRTRTASKQEELQIPF